MQERWTRLEHRMRSVTIIRMAITSPSSRETQWWRTVGVGNLAERREIDSGVLAGRCWIYNSVRHPLQRATCRHATATPPRLRSRWIKRWRTFLVGSKTAVFIALTRLKVVPRCIVMAQWIFILKMKAIRVGTEGRLKVIEVLSGNINSRNNHVNDITFRVFSTDICFWYIIILLLLNSYFRS